MKIRAQKTLASTAVLTAAALSMSSAALAQGSVPGFASVFSDHAVLQRDQPINVWGTAAASRPVTVTLDGRTVTTTADAKGIWRASLAPHAAGSGYTLTASSDAGTATLNDIAVGDVYLCSGQSNMEFQVKYATNAWGEANSSTNANLRFMTVDHDSQPKVVTRLKGTSGWKTAAPETTGEASAVCYYAAKALQKKLNIPVGFIATSWGGTPIESWISAGSLKAVPEFEKGVKAIELYGSAPDKALAALDTEHQAWLEARDPAAKAQRAWRTADFDDSAWGTYTPTGSWRSGGPADLKDFEGVVWYRNTVTLTAAQAATANELTLGPIDMSDSTWVNGVLVGSGNTNWAWRDYLIGGGVFKPGKNTIAIRVISGRTNGGLTGLPKFRSIKTSDGQYIPLPAEWKYKRGSALTGAVLPSSPWDVPTSLTTLYNGMIAPLAGYNVKMAMWYQGEANVGRAEQYRKLLGVMMSDWRKAFNEPELPFLIVQLTSFGDPSSQPGASGWAELREAQAQAARNDGHAGYVVTVDFGDRTDIHPTQKTVVGNRLARMAQVLVYGEKITAGGPEATGIARSGNDLVVNFAAAAGLKTYSANVAIGFETCTAAGACAYTPGTVSGSTIVLKGANQAGVVKVRYAWSEAPYVNLYNGDDLPAAPFQMDVK